MAQIPFERISFYWGEEKVTNSSSKRAYFYVYNLKTGARTSIDSSVLFKKKESNRSSTPYGSWRRDLTVEPLSEAIVEFLSIKTALGSVQSSQSIFLSIERDAPRVSITGIEGWGNACGRFTLCFKRDEEDSKSTTKKLDPIPLAKGNFGIFTIDILGAPIGQAMGAQECGIIW